MDVLVEVPPDAEDVDEGDGAAEWHSSSKVTTLTINNISTANRISHSLRRNFVT